MTCHVKLLAWWHQMSHDLPYDLISQVPCPMTCHVMSCHFSSPVTLPCPPAWFWPTVCVWGWLCYICQPPSAWAWGGPGWLQRWNIGKGQPVAERGAGGAACILSPLHLPLHGKHPGTSHSMTTPKICPKVSPKGNQGLREWMRPERGGCTYTHKAHCSYCSTNHMAETAAEEVSLVLD